MTAFFALMAALSYGVADFAGGLATRRTPVTAVVLWSQTVGLLIAFPAIVLFSTSHFSIQDVLWSILAGLAGVTGVSFLYKGLAVGLASVTTPSAALVAASVPVLFGLITGENPSLITWSGIAVALPAIFLLSRTREKGKAVTDPGLSLRYGILAGTTFGAFYIFISRTGSNSGLWPLLAARCGSIPALVLLSRIQKRRLCLNKGSVIPVLTAGILDMSANIFYLLSVRTGMLITASIITSTGPAPTVILQRIFFNEKLDRSKIAGLLLAVIGVALIGAGDGG